MSLRLIHGTIGLYMIVSLIFLTISVIKDIRNSFWAGSFVCSFVIFFIMGMTFDFDDYKKRRIKNEFMS